MDWLNAAATNPKPAKTLRLKNTGFIARLHLMEQWVRRCFAFSSRNVNRNSASLQCIASDDNLCQHCGHSRSNDDSSKAAVRSERRNVVRWP